MTIHTAVTPNTAAGNPAPIPATTSKLVYDDMNVSNGGIAREALVGTTFTDVYDYDGSGLFYGFVLTLEDVKKWQFALTIDGNEIFGSSGISTADMVDDALYGYTDDPAKQPSSALGFQFIKDTIKFDPPLNYPIIYTTSVTIKIRRLAGEASKKFKAGLVALSKET